MKTFSPKKSDIKRDWYIIDAKDKVLGKMAPKIADIIRGKHKPMYSSHIDCGDFVIVINAKEVKLTGKKATDKEYNYHTRYAGGLKTATPAELIALGKSEQVIEHAVAGMISHNKLKKDILSKLKVFSGAEHPHTAQQPKEIVL